MLLRNIEVSSGLVNGSIGTVTKVHYGIDSNEKIEKLSIRFEDCGEREIVPVNITIPLSNGGQITRSQFAITLAYAITDHKAQGITVKRCVVDIGDSIFSKGQSYVALSRVESLDGLYILNFNPSSIDANESAIVEYNRLRQKYRPTLAQITYHSAKNKMSHDKNIYFKKLLRGTIEPTLQIEKVDSNKKKPPIVTKLRGFINDSRTACYANASIQCLFNIKAVENIILSSKQSTLKDVLSNYRKSKENECLDLTSLRTQLRFRLEQQQDAADFILELINHSETDYLAHLCQFIQTIYINCVSCSYKNQEVNLYYMRQILIPDQNQKPTYTMQQLIDHNLNDQEDILPDSHCSRCQSLLNSKTSFSEFKDVVIFNIQLKDEEGNKMQNLKIDSSSVTRNDITLDKKRYSFSGAVFHHGSRFDSGHYTAYLRVGGSLIKMNDRIVGEKGRWPNNCKDIYVLLYTRSLKSSKK